MTFRPVFSEPQSHWSTPAPPARPKQVRGRGARADSRPPGERQRPAASGKDNVLSPNNKFFHKSATPMNRERKRTPQGRYRPSRRGNPNLESVEPAPPGEDTVITGSQIFPCIYNSNTLGTRTAVPWVDTAPHGVAAPTRSS